MRECKRQGCRVILLTAEKLRDADWPRESLDDTFYLPEQIALADIVEAVTHLARSHKLDRIVALDEFDMETAATLREHLRIPGMGLTTMRYFRDKLAMRMRALDRHIRVPDFVPVVNHDDIRYYLDHVPGPWVLKPRQEASAIGITKIHAAEELWPLLDQLGDKQSSYLLEKFLPGDVYHVDSVVSENQVVFANVSKYGKPPMNVAHGGGIFTTFTVPRGSEADTALRAINRDLIGALGLLRGVAHAEFIRAHAGRAILFSGMRRARRRRLHQRDGRGRDRNQSLAGVGSHRNRQRRRQLQAATGARGVCRSDSLTRAAGKSGYIALQRSGSLSAHQEASPRRVGAAIDRPSPHSNAAGGLLPPLRGRVSRGGTSKREANRLAF